MASDDMHVVMYKILKYLYECLKKGVEPNMQMFDADALGVNERYWAVIMQELMERGYVAGFVTKQLGKDVKIIPKNPSVTMEGVEFILDNSMMKKAMDFIREARDFIPLP